MGCLAVGAAFAAALGAGEVARSSPSSAVSYTPKPLGLPRSSKGFLETTDMAVDS